MTTGFFMPAHVVHLPGKTLVKPIAQAIEAVGLGRRCDTDQLEAQRIGLGP